jgi:hypothetical protein
MAYQWSFINKSIQSGIINYTLKLVDDQGNLQDLYIPVVLTEAEDTQENLNNIGSTISAQINSETQTPVVESISEETPIVNTEIL